MIILSVIFIKYWNIFLFGLYFTQVSICGHVIPNHISMPVRSQARVAQVLKNINKSNQKEISSSAKARIKYVQSEKESTYKPLPLSIKQSGTPILQLFARRSGAGHWAMFLERVVEKELFDLSAQFNEGGICAEIVRSDIECYVAQQVFGKGLGDPPILDEVRKVLPQFSKLKPRLFEFGFKIFSIDESGPVNTLSRSMTKLPIDNEDSNILHEELAKIIAIESIVKGAEGRQLCTLNNYSDALQAQISSFVANINPSNVTEILISSDGSAWMRGSRCGDASAGIVFLAPTVPAGQESAAVECGRDGDDNDEVGNGFFQRFFNASYQDEEAKPFASSSHCSLMLRVGAAGGMVSTPFDAELIACLAAITVARVIADMIEKARDTDTQRDSGDVSPRPLPTTVRFVLRTDSRSLCRAVRSRKLSVAAVQEAEPATQGDEDPISLAQANRRCLWELMMKHVDQTNLTGLIHIHRILQEYLMNVLIHFY